MTKQNITSSNNQSDWKGAQITAVLRRALQELPLEEKLDHAFDLISIRSAASSALAIEIFKKAYKLDEIGTVCYLLAHIESDISETRLNKSDYYTVGLILDPNTFITKIADLSAKNINQCFPEFTSVAAKASGLVEFIEESLKNQQFRQAFITILTKTDTLTGKDSTVHCNLSDIAVKVRVYADLSNCLLNLVSGFYFRSNLLVSLIEHIGHPEISEFCLGLFDNEIPKDGDGYMMRTNRHTISHDVRRKIQRGLLNTILTLENISVTHAIILTKLLRSACELLPDIVKKVKDLLVSAEVRASFVEESFDDSNYTTVIDEAIPEVAPYLGDPKVRLALTKVAFSTKWDSHYSYGNDYHVVTKTYTWRYFKEQRDLARAALANAYSNPKYLDELVCLLSNDHFHVHKQISKLLAQEDMQRVLLKAFGNDERSAQRPHIASLISSIMHEPHVIAEIESMTKHENSEVRRYSYALLFDEKSLIDSGLKIGDSETKTYGYTRVEYRPWE